MNRDKVWSRYSLLNSGNTEIYAYRYILSAIVKLGPIEVDAPGGMDASSATELVNRHHGLTLIHNGRQITSKKK